MRIFLSILFIFNLQCIQGQTYQSHFQEASTAYKANDYSQMLVEIKKAHALRPQHQTLIYYLAKAYSLNSNIDSANYWLREVVSIDAKNYDIQSDDFEILKNTQAYKNTITYQTEMLKPIISSDTVIVIPDEELHIEDVAYNLYAKSYLLSSINNRNIYSFKEGEIKPFFENPFPLAITGMGVQDTILWFTGAGFSQAGLDENDPNFETSKLYKADLKKGIVLDSFSVEDSETNVFGDVILSENGIVLVSDSKTNTIYRLENGKLIEWISSDEILSLQGVAQLGEMIFLADYVQGLFVYDTVQNSIRKLNTLPDLALKGIDGLYAYKNGLIAIQNGVTPHRITHLQFDEKYTKVKSFNCLEKNHPAMGEPTLGYIQNDSLFYIATSFWGLNENGKVKNEKRIKPVILRLPLANSSNPKAENQYCNSENHRAFDFWLGNWEVYNKKGDHIGTNNVHLIQNGCGIQENWTSKGGGTGISNNFYDVKTEKWYQSWISSSGNALMMSGGFSEGKMQMQSEPLNGKIDRITWIPQEDGSVLQIWEISTDNGKTWKEAFWGRYVRNRE
ncbi:hypothetical protein QYS49_13035 [Marivirga salinae]|uniref:Tetratricopeptide repeat protein n=1 Tax=Marivirga salinarum TaxID=3059078 RepID=A0AA49GBR5_9BACT|nr:hypothetical protein [Marivirga sp. BDSF4-3]WKK77913.2 hypothetical protein QYS49_13035 [Marivirga sp. BDSF4-3]